MSTHENYLELSALAASGQASYTELEELRSHLQACPTCRSVAYDFTQLSVQALSEIAAKRFGKEAPSGMAQRFVARAHSEGIGISDEMRPKRSVRSRYSPFNTVMLGTAVAMIVLLSSFGIFKSKVLRMQTDRPSTAPLISSPFPDPGKHSEAAAESVSKEELVAVRKRLSSMEALLKMRRSQLESWKNHNNSFLSQMSQSQEQNAAFERETTERENRIKQLESALEKAKSENDANTAVLASEENEVHDLRGKVFEQSEALKQQQILTAKGNDIRDLVVARNLHIIDVHDRDGTGRSQQTFGRIFYTEGKSLIFYAYDLADPNKLNARLSFHVWGERLGSNKPIRSLGVFHTDDASDGRWMLTFDDPQVLAEIDSVFVTAEPSQKLAKEPRGTRMLYAFLSEKPNHP